MRHFHYSRRVALATTRSPRNDCIQVRFFTGILSGSKVLFGKIETTSFHVDSKLVAKRSRPIVLTSSDPAHLGTVFPHIDNLHNLYALTNCAFVDIIGPPYDDSRPCTYYKVVRHINEEQDQVELAIDDHDLVMDDVSYTGQAPVIDET